MDDRIDFIDSSATPELVYQVVDKLSRTLNVEDSSFFQGNNYSCTRESTSTGITIKVRKYSSGNKNDRKTMKFIADNINKKVTIFLEQQSWLSPHIAAILYEENSESCRNFLAQIANEEKKVSIMLEEILAELNSRKIPNVPKEERAQLQEGKTPTQLRSMLLTDTPWYMKLFNIK